MTFARADAAAPLTPLMSAGKAVLLCTIALTLLRSLTPILERSLNSDEALIGLMAKHLSEGRAFPLYLYSVPYVLGIESWIAAPFFLAGGPTVPMLKLPLALMNVAIAWLLILGLLRHARLKPGLAFVAVLPFVLAPPILSHSHLMDAGGNGPEPLLIILLLWTLRRSPLLFGGLLALGFLNRPFVIYGAAALLVVQWRERARWADWLRFWVVAAVGAVAVFDLVWSLRPWWSPRGPGTSFDPTQPYSGLSGVGFLCVDPRTVVGGIWNFSAGVLPFMLGEASEEPRMPYLAAAAVVLIAGRVLWISRTHEHATPRRHDFPIYLIVAGVLSPLVYAVARCGEVDVRTMRYALMTPFAFVGVLGLLFALEPVRHVRRILAALVCVWAAWQAFDHTQLLVRVVASGPISPRIVLAAYLEKEGIHYARAGFWDAQVITFLTRERVIVASDDIVRIEPHQQEVQRNDAKAVRIRHRPCRTSGREAVPGRYWVCSPTEPPG